METKNLTECEIVINKAETIGMEKQVLISIVSTIIDAYHTSGAIKTGFHVPIVVVNGDSLIARICNQTDIADFKDDETSVVSAFDIARHFAH